MTNLHIRFLIAIIVIALLAAGCTGPAPISQPTLTTVPELPPALTHTPASSPTAAVSPEQLTPTQPPTATMPPTPTATPPVSIGVWPGARYDTLFTIPANTGTGIRYRNLGVANAQVEGPNTFTILADGSFVIHDIINEGVVIYSATGEFLQGIPFRGLLPAPTAADLAAVGNLMYVLQEPWGPGPETYWLHRLSAQGELLESFKLPAHVNLEAGLTGIVAAPDGSVLAELEGGARLIELLDADGNESGLQTPGLIFNEQAYWTVGKSGAAGPVGFESEFSEMGNLQILGINPDGSFYVVRQDLLTQEVFKVDVTVHLLSAGGETLGIARYPLDEWLYPPRRFLARGPDGQVYGLLPLRNGLQIIRLRFFDHLEPFLPGAVEPVIRVMP